MTCEDYRDLLVAFHDDELSESELNLVKRHLQDCDGCSQELAEIRQFAQKMHTATAPFRESVQRISAPRSAGGSTRSFRIPSWAAIAAVLLLLASFWYVKFSGPDTEELASWGIQHYALVDQTHPFHGNAAKVEEWFQDHHKVSIKAPSDINYSRLTGCKFTQMHSQPVALLRLEEKPVKAVFILPEKRIIPFPDKVLYRNGYQIRFWQEQRTLYMSLSTMKG